MFRGNQCSDRCKNSLAILRRQEKASKLRHCECKVDETLDDFLCADIKRNMEELCADEEEVIDEGVAVDVDITTDVTGDAIGDVDSATTETDDLNEVDVDSRPQKNGGGENFRTTVIVFVSTIFVAFEAVKLF